MNIKTYRYTGLIAYLCVYASPIFAANPVSVAEMKTITADWSCQWCPKPQSAITKGSVTGKTGYVSNDSARHGDYTGLDKKGGYLAVDAEVEIQTDKNQQVEIRASNVGLESQKVELQGGRQGHYNASVSYDQIPKYQDDTSRTPYSGESNKTLPTDWQAGSTTADFATLENDLQNVDINTRRDTFSFDGQYIQSPKISYDVNYRRDSKEGNRTAGVALGSIFAAARAVVQVVPVDYVTDNVKLSANYQHHRINASVSVETSSFNNNNEAVQWQNAFTNPAQVDSGQVALTPDNSAQQLSFSGTYKFSSTTTTAAYFSMGQMSQDQAFLPYTTNTALPVSALPRSSLDGKIKTIHGGLDISSYVNDKLKLYLKYSYQDQDNDTDRASYQYVTADTQVNSTIRANFPYGFRKQKLDLKLSYPVLMDSVATAGINTTQFDRTYQEVSKNRDIGIWAKLKTKINETTEAWFRLENENRNGDAYTSVDEILPPENSLLRKYNMADRDRNKIALNLSHYPTDKFDVNVSLAWLKDDYHKSEIGLVDSEQADLNLDLTYKINVDVSVNGYLGLSQLESSQLGKNWRAVNNESFDILGLSLGYDLIPDKFKLRIDVETARSVGETSLPTATDGEFPNVTIDRDTINIRGDYQLREKLLISMLYRYEQYDEQDWMIGSVLPNTIPNVLTLGEQSPSYKIGVFAVGLKYDF